MLFLSFIGMIRERKRRKKDIFSIFFLSNLIKNTRGGHIIPRKVRFPDSVIKVTKRV
jgi:hypothetical protein